MLIAKTGRILQFRGDTTRYLAPAPGRPNFDVLRMARAELRMPLQAALQKARDTGEPVDQIQVRSDAGFDSAYIDVRFLQRPFTSEDLSREVRRALDAADPSV